MNGIILWILVASAWLPLGALAQEKGKPRVEPKPRGERILAIGVNDTQDGDYDKAFTEARRAGLHAMVHTFEWRDLETAPGVFQPNPNFLRDFNSYYPQTKTPVHLMILPIHTNQDVRPRDLLGKPFDDPSVIARFKKLLDFVFSQIPDVVVPSLSIGTEIDGFLGEDPRRWQAYEAFYKEVAEYARQKRKGVKIAAEAMSYAFSGKIATYLKSLNRHSDVIGASYYPVKDDLTVQPLTAISKAFQTITALVPDKPVYFYQIGFPSGEGVRSSPELQADFIRELFSAWDAYAERIGMLHLNWMNDLPPETLQAYTRFYAQREARFGDFLATLGLRAYSGEEKPAWKVLKEEAKARGW
jgi:hypothetical protein